MTSEKAIKEFPTWASAEAVRILDEPVKQEEPPLRHRMTVKQERFIRRYGLALAAILAFAIYTVGLCVVTGSIVRRNTLSEMETQYRAKMQAYIDDQEQQRMAAGLLTGEASRQAGMELEAREISRVLYGIKDNSENDLRTCVWCILNRVDNAGYPNSVYEVCSQSQQWMGYSPENPVLDNLYKIAHSELDTWYSGTRPVDSSYIYLNWTPSRITLRDRWENSSATNYWRFGA